LAVARGPVAEVLRPNASYVYRVMVPLYVDGDRNVTFPPPSAW
jgi:hypothetical protein